MSAPEIKHIIHAMMQLQGITRYYLLNKEEMQAISEMEDRQNWGVLDAVKHKYCVCLVHDSSWRIPTQSIVKKVNGEIIFPPVAFPEVPAKNVVSSSPGMKVHEFLCKRVPVSGDEATLLIGFDM